MVRRRAPLTSPRRSPSGPPSPLFYWRFSSEFSSRERLEVRHENRLSKILLPSPSDFHPLRGSTLPGSERGVPSSIPPDPWNPSGSPRFSPFSPVTHRLGANQQLAGVVSFSFLALPPTLTLVNVRTFQPKDPPPGETHSWIE